MPELFFFSRDLKLSLSSDSSVIVCLNQISPSYIFLILSKGKCGFLL